MPSPLNSGAALIHAATLTGNLPGGWALLRGPARTTARMAGGGNGDILKSVAGGEKLYGVIVDFMPIREKAKGAPVEFVFPKEGVSAVTEPVAILKTHARTRRRPRPSSTSCCPKDGQDLALKQGYIPAHPGVALPAGYPARRRHQGHELRRRPRRSPTRPGTRRTFADIFGQ